MNVYFRISGVKKNIPRATDLIAAVNGWFVCGTPEQADFLVYDNDSGSGKESGTGPSLELPRPLLRQISEIPETAELYRMGEPLPQVSVPALDRQLQALHRALCEQALKNGRPFIYKLPWPAGRPFAVALTHDVDLTRPYGLKTLMLKMLRRDFRVVYQAAGDMVRRENRYWTFPELAEFYRLHGWKATFFFLARAREDRGFRYFIRSPKFRRLLGELRQAGHETGLHSSRYAFDYPGRILRERHILEQVAGRPLSGVRQHYLRLTYPEAFHRFAGAGFRYDSSCGWNEHPGFRAGTSFPFCTVADGENGPFYEIPFSLMDYSWANPAAPFEENRETFLNIAGQVEGTGGLLNVLWHPSNLAEPFFRPYWDKLMEWLEARQFYQATLEEIVRWWQARQQVRLGEVNRRAGRLEFALFSDRPLQNLVLGIFSDKEISEVNGPWQVSKDGRYENRLTIPHLNAGKQVISVELRDE